MKKTLFTDEEMARLLSSFKQLKLGERKSDIFDDFETELIYDTGTRKIKWCMVESIERNEWRIRLTVYKIDKKTEEFTIQKKVVHELIAVIQQYTEEKIKKDKKWRLKLLLGEMEVNCFGKKMKAVSP